MQTRARTASDDMAAPLDYETCLSRFGEKDRKTLSRHLANYEEKLGPGASGLWCRLVGRLMALAPNPAKVVAQQAIQFFVPDGKYRRQVFALQATDDGSLTIYARNALTEAVRDGVLSKPKASDDPKSYRIRGSEETLIIDLLDGQTPNPAPICKSMTGWNRKAVCITLPPHATPDQVRAAERLCALAATE